MPHKARLLSSFALTLALPALGCQPGEGEGALDCRLHITLSGAVHGAFDYGSSPGYKQCGGAGEGAGFTVDWGQEGLPFMGMWTCGVAAGALGAGYADLSANTDDMEWSAFPADYECGPSSMCTIEVTRNELKELEEPPFSGGKYWVEGEGVCSRPIPARTDLGDPGLTVEGTFTFAALVGLWE
jgi:hypothetical protein